MTPLRARAVVTLFLAGFLPRQVARLLRVPYGEVVAVIRQQLRYLDT